MSDNNRKEWSELSAIEKAEVMKIALQSGISDLEGIKTAYNSYANGGSVYINKKDSAPKKRKYVPSDSIKKRISNWEGKAMTGAKDPLSGKFLTNNSFEYEADAFTNALSESVKHQVLSNPNLADNLFSYSYNVGAGAFKNRVVPAIEDYYNGTGAASQIAASMWASGDSKLRGLHNRREEEKAGVRASLYNRGRAEVPSSTEFVNPFSKREENKEILNWAEPFKSRDIARDYVEQNNWDRAVDAYKWDNWPLVPQYEPNEYKNGGGIHIKPSKKGTFTAAAKKHGKSVQAFASQVLAHPENYSTAMRKKANFARNAAKWHGYGGHIYDGTEEESQQMHRPPIVPFTRSKEVIITPDKEYTYYLNTLPDNQRLTPNNEYDSYLYWKLHGKPKDFKEAYAKGMFNYDHSDNGYHANSIAWGKDGIGYFMKPKTHSTVHMETDWFNKGLVAEEGGWQRPETFQEWKDAREFRNSYELVDDPNRPNFYRYQPKKKSLGGHLYDKGSILLDLI